MDLKEGIIVQRQDMSLDRWSLPMVIDSPQKLHYHQSFQLMDYRYRLFTASE